MGNLSIGAYCERRVNLPKPKLLKKGTGRQSGTGIFASYRDTKPVENTKSSILEGIWSPEEFDANVEKNSLNIYKFIFSSISRVHSMSRYIWPLINQLNFVFHFVLMLSETEQRFWVQN